MRRNLVLVSTKAQPKDKNHGPIVTMETSSDTGTIIDLGPEVEELKVGQKVYFLSNHKTVSIRNESYLVMEEDNIFATE